MGKNIHIHQEKKPRQETDEQPELVKADQEGKDEVEVDLIDKGPGDEDERQGFRWDKKEGAEKIEAAALRSIDQGGLRQVDREGDEEIEPVIRIDPGKAMKQKFRRRTFLFPFADNRDHDEPADHKKKVDAGLADAKDVRKVMVAACIFLFDDQHMVEDDADGRNSSQHLDGIDLLHASFFSMV